MLDSISISFFGCSGKYSHTAPHIHLPKSLTIQCFLSFSHLLASLAFMVDFIWQVGESKLDHEMKKCLGKQESRMLSHPNQVPLSFPSLILKHAKCLFGIFVRNIIFCNIVLPVPLRP